MATMFSGCERGHSLRKPQSICKYLVILLKVKSPEVFKVNTYNVISCPFYFTP
jgi:hypothetical protein